MLQARIPRLPDAEGDGPTEELMVLFQEERRQRLEAFPDGKVELLCELAAVDCPKHRRRHQDAGGKAQAATQADQHQHEPRRAPGCRTAGDIGQPHGLPLSPFRGGLPCTPVPTCDFGRRMDNARSRSGFARRSFSVRLSAARERCHAACRSNRVARSRIEASPLEVGPLESQTVSLGDTCDLLKGDGPWLPLPVCDRPPF